MGLARQWRELESTLPTGWESARLRLRVSDATMCDRAAALMGPAQPYRVGQQELRFAAARDFSAPSPDSLVRLLARLDRQHVHGTLELVGAKQAVQQAEEEAPSLLVSWDAAVVHLPADWSDLYAEMQLLSTDYIERGALLCAPLNPRRDGARAALRFRSAARFGYGASPQMVRRCLERCDTEAIRGTVTVLRVLCDTGPVATQGPVWLMSGNTV